MNNRYNFVDNNLRAYITNNNVFSQFFFQMKTLHNQYEFVTNEGDFVNKCKVRLQCVNPTPQINKTKVNGGGGVEAQAW